MKYIDAVKRNLFPNFEYLPTELQIEILKHVTNSPYELYGKLYRRDNNYSCDAHPKVDKSDGCNVVSVGLSNLMSKEISDDMILEENMVKCRYTKKSKREIKMRSTYNRKKYKYTRDIKSKILDRVDEDNKLDMDTYMYDIEQDKYRFAQTDSDHDSYYYSDHDSDNYPDYYLDYLQYYRDM